MTIVLRRLVSPDHNKILSNPYFWLTLVLVLVIAAIYYLNHMIWDERWPWFWHLSLFEFSHDINGSLMYIPFILAAIFLGVRGLLIIWGTAMILMLPVIINYTPDPQSVFTNIIFMIAPMLIIGYISLQIKWRDQERKIITEREKEKQYYLSRILKAQDDERKRIAQELHDDTTQILLVVATHVQSIISDKYFKAGSEPAERMEWIKNTVLHLSDDIRRISVELRPSILDNVEFIPALESLVESLEQNYGIETLFEVSGNERDIPKDYQISLIRVVQEALTNIRRHSKATKASVKLHFSEKEILLTIEDNGRGFAEDDEARSLTDTKKLGIIGMRERIGSLGGTFDIHSETGKGTQIIIKLIQK
jgi:two-component system sensor histidine kinase DegS